MNGDVFVRETTLVAKRTKRMERKKRVERKKRKEKSTETFFTTFSSFSVRKRRTLEVKDRKSVPLNVKVVSRSQGVF